MNNLNDIALSVRQNIFKMAFMANGGHIAPAYSMTEIVVDLYFDDVLKYDPKNPNWIDRDYFILSKGHGVLSLYSVLAMAGYFSVDELNTFCKIDSRLGSLAKSNSVPGVEATTGSLGHGLSYAVGIALANKIDKKISDVYVLLGDGECQEGSIWEAVMSAVHHKLDNLVVIVDYNKLQAMDSIDNIMSISEFKNKFISFGFETLEIDGHNFKEIRKALTYRVQGKPVAIIASTVKGKGLSFMENRPIWHYRIPNEDELEIALRELNMSREELGNYEKCLFRNII